jgi:DNA-binding transcriptional LysR family regulator
MRFPPEFDLHALETFVLVVELGGMSQCAAHLQVTQSAISQTIARLEAGIGVQLFDRSLRPLALTTNGRALFERSQRLLAQAKLTYDAVREQAALPVAHVTVAMSFSLANQLTAPLLETLGTRADRWTIRSGISREHQGEFLARDIDMLVTGSFNLEHRHMVELHPVFEEGFVLVFPAGYQESIDLHGNPPPLPFVRFSHLTGMGQQIERQLVRMKLRMPQTVEVESADQQLRSVAAGYGWTITTPVCLAAQHDLFGRLRIEPMPRGQFSRAVQVVARVGELGSLPGEIAALATKVLRDTTLPPLIDRFPWLAGRLRWTGKSEGTRNTDGRPPIQVG